MFHKRLLIFSLLLTVLTCGLAHAAAPEETPLPFAPSASLPIGEHLVYKITWLWIPVGTGEVWVQEKTMLKGREVIPVRGVLSTNRILSRIFPIHDEAFSWVDAKTLQSVQFEKDIREIKIKTHEKMSFEVASGKGVFERFQTGEMENFYFTAPVQDVFSVIYWVRRQILTPGASVKTVLVADEKEWALEACVRGRKMLKFHGKKIPTLRIEPVTQVGGKVRRNIAWFYVTDDASHKPLRIVYKAPFGTMVGTLQDPDA